MRIYLLILFYSFVSFNLKAQRDTSLSSWYDDAFCSVQYGNAVTLAHRKSLAYLINEYPYTFNIEIGKAMNGGQYWHQLFNYPYLGIGYAHFTLGNNTIFGTANALYGFIDVPYYPEKRITLNYKVGVGMSYLSKCFSLDDNIMNFAIGSHLNVYFNLAFDLKYALLKKRLYLALGVGLTHVSNGKIQTPNLGLNILDLHISTRYLFGKRRLKVKRSSVTKNKHTFLLIGAGGVKEYSRPNQGKFFAGNLTFEYERTASDKISWGIGTDIFYDGVLQDEYRIEDDSSPFLHAHRAGLHLTYIYYYNRIAFIIQMGSYLFPYNTDDGYIYHRVGLRAYVSKNLLVNLTMKTHWARADIVELGLGYYWNR